MKRILPGILVIASVSWIIYFTVDLISLKNNLSAEELFGPKDSVILVVNRQNEINLSAIEEFQEAEIRDLYHALKDSAFDIAYLSAVRPHALLIRESGWNEQEIRNLFLNIEVDQLNPSEQTFRIGTYSAKYYKQGLYLFKGELNHSDGIRDEPAFDKKASGALIAFTKNSSPIITDIYFKQNGRFDFVTHNTAIKQGKQIRDEELFAPFISDKITSYHFYERDYYATKDTLFARGPMYSWLDKGFVEVSIGDDKALISDYILGQDPLLILADLEQTDSAGLHSTMLTETFPGKGNYYIDYLEDLIVISKKREVCDQLLADYKLGQTIALNGPLNAKIFGNLPQLVSERYIHESLSMSKSIYNGHILMTRADMNIRAASATLKTNVTINVGARIIDFAVLKGEGNVVVIDHTNALSLFKAGVKQWSKPISGFTGNIQIVDIYANGQQQVLLQTENEIHLFELSGEYVSGYPVNLDEDLTNEVNFYRWKGQGFIIVATADQKVHLYDMHGRERDVIQAGIDVKRKIDIWTSQSKLFYGFTDNTSFVMYDADKNRVHRRFEINGQALSARIPNELIQFKLRDDRLIRIDQKGSISEFDNFIQGKILRIKDDNKNPVIIIKSLNELKFVNSQGLLFGSIKLPFNEITYVDLITTQNGKTLISIMDGLENNVYLYSLDGSKISQKPLEGQLKVEMSEENAVYKLTTIVDQFIVQYFEN